MKKASFFERFIAIFIDGLVLGVGFHFLRLGGLFLFVLYETILLSQWNGQTIGKKVMGLKVVTTSGKKPDWVKALIRSLSRALSGILLLGYLWMLWDEKSQTWHDKIADTYVVKA